MMRRLNWNSALLWKFGLVVLMAACAPADSPTATDAPIAATNVFVAASATSTEPPAATETPTVVPTLAPTLPTAGEAPGGDAKVKGIILFIGDGMGLTQRTAGRWVMVGQDGLLKMDQMQVAGWAQTRAFQNPVTDSAAAGTALASGVKTRNGRIGVDPDGQAVTTILEQAQQRGWATGLVTTTMIAHATPAAFAAHVSERSNMTEIASQMLALQVDVLLGGGEHDWLPSGATGCHPGFGTRDDGRDLVDEAQAVGYTYVCEVEELLAVDTASTTRLLGLFAGEGFGRPFSPTLAEMTQVAIAILSQDEDGFFLMVEGGQIDWAGHDNDPEGVFGSMAGFDAAVAVGQAYLQTEVNKLMIVTADHETGGMSIYFESTGSFREDGPFEMPDGTLFYVTWGTRDHTGVDVPVSASGPWAYLLAGHYSNTYIYEVMWAAMTGEAP
ncbi:MAG: alkaline phosphatase [Chloroflexi bacterium]|nr:alkaline phosphatase [Chloroflexota bacterium]